MHFGGFEGLLPRNPRSRRGNMVHTVERDYSASSQIERAHNSSSLLAELRLLQVARAGRHQHLELPPLGARRPCRVKLILAYGLGHDLLDLLPELRRQLAALHLQGGHPCLLGAQAVERSGLEPYLCLQ